MFISHKMKNILKRLGVRKLSHKLPSYIVRIVMIEVIL